jgi:hypothetical protein
LRSKALWQVRAARHPGAATHPEQPRAVLSRRGRGLVGGGRRLDVMAVAMTSSATRRHRRSSEAMGARTEGARLSRGCARRTGRRMRGGREADELCRSKARVSVAGGGTRPRGAEYRVSCCLTLLGLCRSRAACGSGSEEAGRRLGRWLDGASGAGWPSSGDGWPVAVVDGRGREASLQVLRGNVTGAGGFAGRASKWWDGPVTVAQAALCR